MYVTEFILAMGQLKDTLATSFIVKHFGLGSLKDGMGKHARASREVVAVPLVSDHMVSTECCGVFFALASLHM